MNLDKGIYSPGTLTLKVVCHYTIDHSSYLHFIYLPFSVIQQKTIPLGDLGVATDSTANSSLSRHTLSLIIRLHSHVPLSTEVFAHLV